MDFPPRELTSAVRTPPGRVTSQRHKKGRTDRPKGLLSLKPLVYTHVKSLSLWQGWLSKYELTLFSWLLPSFSGVALERGSEFLLPAPDLPVGKIGSNLPSWIRGIPRGLCCQVWPYPRAAPETPPLESRFLGSSKGPGCFIKQTPRALALTAIHQVSSPPEGRELMSNLGRDVCQALYIP